jgi:uncharacterized protein
MRLSLYEPVGALRSSAAELRAFDVQRIGVFDSFARGEATAESDGDVYLEFAKGRKTYDNFFAIYELLEGIFGRSIDLVTYGSLSERKVRIIFPSCVFPPPERYLIIETKTVTPLGGRL